LIGAEHFLEIDLMSHFSYRVVAFHDSISFSHQSSYYCCWRLAPETALAVTGNRTGSNGTNYAYTTANTWIYSPISISGAPTGAQITSIQFCWNVDSNYITDIDYYFDGPAYVSPTWAMDYTGQDDFEIWPDTSYTQTRDTCRTVTPSGTITAINGTWWFNLADTINDSNAEWNKGRIDSWNITINYTVRQTLVVIVDNTTVNTNSSVTVTGRLDGPNPDPNDLYVQAYLNVMDNERYLNYDYTYGGFRGVLYYDGLSTLPLAVPKW
jgi:hypothetical protein